MTKTDSVYDLIVIGTGVAASTVAWECHSAGWKIAVIDSRPFGGTCALRGCDPKKVLVGAAEVIDWSHRMSDKGIDNTEDIHINWPELMRFKRSFTEPVPKRREEQFSKAGIVTFHGQARFTNPTNVEVKEKSGSNQLISGHYILVATGAKPVKLNIPGEEFVTKSDQFLELEDMPEKIVFIGGGYISFEFAHIAARSGAKKVTILHRSKKPLDQFDSDLVDQLVEKTRELGVDVQLQTEVKGIVRSSDNVLAVKALTSPEDGNTKEENVIKTDMVIHGAGRVPDIEELNLEAAGIEYDPKKGIKINEYLQSISNPAVYAAGDVAAAGGGPPLTPVATYDGKIVASNLLKGNHLKPNYNGIPSVVFTIPPLASVGLQEGVANELGLHFRTNYQKDTSSWYTSRRIGESHSGFKVLIEREEENNNPTGASANGDRILGAHILGAHAEEIINIFALAIRLGLNTTDIKEAILSYPTKSSDISYML